MKDIFRFGVQLDLYLKHHMSQNKQNGFSLYGKFAKDRAKTFIIFGARSFTLWAFFVQILTNTPPSQKRSAINVTIY